MKKELLNKIIQKKKEKKEFAIVTNIANGYFFIFEKNNALNKNFGTYKEEMNLCFDKKTNGIINK